VVAEGVVAMWIRCLDLAGNTIPWLSELPDPYDSGTIQYNSAAFFQMTNKNAVFPPVNPVFENEARTFRYTAGTIKGQPGSITIPAHLLPGSVEITLIVVDTRTLQRGLTVPEMPAPPVDPEDVPDQITQFNRDLINAGITTARTFTTRVKMANTIF
jgi:hypothetical protein